ncbi:unnamed protein product [Urochloa decumbens]|uniref:Uncharacterized protein n=1 Tax=Urochloa decumbens TaxID=240449 RepID=A0ABC9ARR1_9POAL
MELVVGASQATMKSLLGKLGDLLAREYALVRGVRGDIQYINDELASMQAFLVNLGASGGANDHDAQTKDWMKQIRDVAYDIEDCLDDFIRRLPSDPRGGGCLAEIRLRIHELWTCSPRRDIAAEIADLKYRAQQVGERRTRYGVKNPESRGANADARPIGFDAAEDQLSNTQLVGIKDPVGMEKNEELDKWVTNIDKRGVLSISGFGGVGKTTIAMALYRKYGDKFDRRATVTVSQGSDREAILRSILNQVKPQANNQGQQVSSRERCEFLKIKLHPFKMWSHYQMQKSRNSGGSSEERHGAVEAFDNEQTNSSAGDGGGGSSSPKQKSRVMQRAHSRNVQNSSAREDDSGNRSPVEKNRVMQRVHCFNVRHSTGGSSNSDQGKLEKNFTVVASFRETFLQVMACAGYRVQHGRKSEHDILVEELQAHLGNKRYFLLIDDIWSATTWQNIKKYLPPGTNGSKIIVTTRFQAVATACNQDEEIDKVHPVDVLSNKDAAKLFEEVVSESRSAKAGQRKKSGKLPDRIWEMCGGLPLAIVTMAGHVACNPHKPRKKWNEVCKSLFPEAPDTRFKKDKPDSLNPEGITKILNYCYNDLPADIKTCSLYLSIFPKGFKISRKRLIRRWVAEGFASEKQGLSEEDVAESYFNHLIRRKIIRPVEHSSNGKVKTCQVHDMILEYIVSKSSEENFTTVIGGHWLVPMHSNKVRRLSLQSIDPNHAKAVEKMNLSHLRSLSVFGSLNQLPSHSLKTGLVQVLDLEGCTGFKEKHIKEISKMLLLKYLSLRKTDINKFPPNIDKLQYLETLDIRETNVEHLPKSVGQLDRMSNIFGGDKMTRKALKLPEEIKMETMRALHILSGIEIVEGSTVLANLHNFTGLKKLVIYKLVRSHQPISKAGNGKGKAYEDLLSALQYLGGYSLQSLTIDDECADFLPLLDTISTPPKYLHALELSGRLLELPGWICALHDLNKLTLSVTALRTDTFELLQKLPRLFSLTFSLSAEKHHKDLVTILEKNKYYSDGVIVVQKDGFQSLKLLRFAVPILPLLSFSENAMPKLERIELRFRMLEGLFGMENLQSLQEVHLRVNHKADETTRLIVGDLMSAVQEFAIKPRVICDEYYDGQK